jgi:type I restriction enzyme M protein
VRRKLLATCDVHTLLRLPTGVFYAQGVKANVLFFDRGPAAETPWTREVWVYDLRTNMHFTLKQKPLHDEHLRDFVAAYCPGDRGARAESERFRRLPTTTWCSATRRASTSSGCGTSRSRTWRTCRRPT